MKLYGWGANNYGQLGLGYLCEQHLFPVEVNSNELNYENIRYITGGGGHTFILDCNGRIYGCGLNSSCQLGFSNCNNISEFKRIECLDKYQISNVTCGWDSSFAVTKDGCALVWGSNTYGQLGFSKDKNKKIEPCQLPLSGVVQISSGLRHTAIVLENGKVLVSGQGRKGQLGISKDNEPVTQTDSFQDVPYLENVKMVACGQHHTLALTRDGNLLAWGDNKHGQLGCDSSLLPCTFTPVLVNSEISSHGIFSMLTGWTHSVFQTEDGVIVNFGRNCYGQLGSPVESRTASWIPKHIPFNRRITQLGVGSEHNLIISESNEVWSWGWNEHGNCGQGHDRNVFTPGRIILPGKSVLIGTGSAHSFALIE